MIVSLSLPFLVGMAGLALEFGNGLIVKITNQRIADAAAYAGALGYSAFPDATDRLVPIEAAADRVAMLNGLPASAATASFGVSPRGNGNTSVQVTVATNAAFMFSRLLGAAPSLTIPASSTAEITTNAPGCIFALAATGTGVTLSGGTTVTAPSCSTASNNTVTAPCGTSVTALTIGYNSATAPVNCTGSSGASLRGPNGASPTIIKKPVTDPLAGSATIKTATDRIATVAAMVSPAAPSGPAAMTGGATIDFGYNTQSTINAAAAMGCTASYNSNIWTFNCPAGSTKTFAAITLGGGIRVNFGATGTAANVYNFRTTLNSSSNGFAFGPGTYNFAQDFTTSGGGTNSFGTATLVVGGSLVNGSSGAFTIAAAPSMSVRGGIANTGSATMTLPASVYAVGQGTTSCNGGYYSVCTTNGPIVFAGPSTFALSSGVYVTGGGRVVFGSGTTNSFDLGRSSNGYGIAVGGGATLTFADATGASSVFRMNGPINFGTGGGSCLTLPAAAQHDINGSLDAAGGLTMGGGTYTINGIVAFGRAGGGAVTCNNKQVSVTGTGVTLVIAGINPPSGSCGDFASAWSFCVASGYSGVDLTAPTGGAMAKLLVVGPTGNATGATFSNGASNANLSGAFYYPGGPVSLGGGAGVGNKAGQCLTLIGTQVSLTGGSVLASACISGATGVAGVVFLR